MVSTKAVALIFVATNAFAGASVTLSETSARALRDMSRRCPEIEAQWKQLLWPLGIDGFVSHGDPKALTVRRGGKSFEFGYSASDAETWVHVEKTNCKSVGYSWAVPYAWGTHIPGAVHPTLWHAGVAVSWTALATDEQGVLLSLMTASLGNPASASLSGVLWRQNNGAAEQEGAASEQRPVTELVGAAVPSTTGKPRSESRVHSPYLQNGR